MYRTKRGSPHDRFDEGKLGTASPERKLAFYSNCYKSGLSRMASFTLCGRILFFMVVGAGVSANHASTNWARGLFLKSPETFRAHIG